MEAIEGLKDIFTGEAEEILQNLEPDIVRLEEGSEPEVVNRIFRSIHTLKGSSGMAGFNDISQFTHKLENLIDKVRSGDLKVDGGLIDILLNSMDWIKMIIFGSDADAGGDKKNKLKEQLLGQIEEYRHNNVPEKLKIESAVGKEITDKPVAYKSDTDPGLSSYNEEEKPGYKFFRVRTGFKESIFKNGIDPLIIMEDLASLGRISTRKVDRTRLPDMKKFDPENCYLNWDITIRTKHTREEIEDIFQFVNDDNQIAIEDLTTNYNMPDKLSPHKIGEIMLSENIITENELSNVLDAQKTDGKKIAEIILEKGYASREDVNYALSEQDKIRKKIESSTVRVATGKLDTLLNLLGEMIIGQSAISKAAELIGGEEGERLKNAVYGMDRTTREFQEQIMAIRMIPIGSTFEQFKRFIRDTAKDYGKEIKLELEGIETEFDKTVIEKINDPLKHMIRNSIDHGIETPDERIKAEKPAMGVISLKAYHQEGNVYIEISDDGRGVDKEKVRRKAEKIGLLKPSDEISDEKLLNFLFLPGFSTTEKVGDLSGRGVGMDVVKTNIEQLRGTIKIDTELGRGTRVIIKLPLTLAIIDGMLVRVGKWIYIIPLLSIIESIQPDKNDVKTVEGRGEVIYIRDRYVTLLRIYELFGIAPEHKNPWEGLVVIVESNGVYLGLLVDELIGEQQIVIKSIDSTLTKSRAISGASILGDGTVSLIMDIHGLIGEIGH
ncbi:MAG: chemotaxis protein CheA [Spirochaetes bacterium]|nr:chemotaxis protein CheA [Spirochaetota bacterium]